MWFVAVSTIRRTASRSKSLIDFAEVIGEMERHPHSADKDIHTSIYGYGGAWLILPLQTTWFVLTTAAMLH